MNYKRNKKYFKEKKLKPGIIASIIGVICLTINSVFGILVIAVGVALILSQIVGRPSDSEIDQVYASQITNIKQKALDKLGLDEEQVQTISPIIFDGTYFKNITTQSWYTRGKDKKVRTSNYRAVILFFSEQQVYTYTYLFSIVNDEKSEFTDEYFYKDIVSAATSSDSVEVTINNKKQKINVEEFKLTTSGGTSISASLTNQADAERSIRAMKQLLRENKLAN